MEEEGNLQIPDTIPYGLPNETDYSYVGEGPAPIQNGQTSLPGPVRVNIDTGKKFVSLATTFDSFLDHDVKLPTHLFSQMVRSQSKVKPEKRVVELSQGEIHLRREIERLKNLLNTERNKHHTLEVDNARLKRDAARLRKEATITKGEKTEAQKQRKLAVDERESKRTELEVLQTQYRSLEQSAFRLEREKQKLEDSTRVLEKSSREHSAKIKECEGDYRSLRQDKAKIEHQLEKRTRSLSDLKDDYDILLEDKAKLDDLFAAKETEVEKLQQGCQEQQLTIQTLHNSLNKVRAEKAELERELEESKKERCHLKTRSDELDTQKWSFQRLYEELEEKHSKTNERNLALEDLEKGLNREKNDLEQKCRSLEDQINIWRKKHEDLQREIPLHEHCDQDGECECSQQEGKESEISFHTHEPTQGDILVLKDTLKKVHAERDQVIEECLTKEATLRGLLEKLEGIQGARDRDSTLLALEKSAFLEQIQQLNHTNSNLLQQLTEHSNEKEQLHSVIDDLKTKCRTLKSELTDTWNSRTESEDRDDFVQGTTTPQSDWREDENEIAIMRRAHQSALRLLSEDCWVPESEQVISHKFRRLNDQISAWSKNYAKSSLRNVYDTGSVSMGVGSTKLGRLLRPVSRLKATGIRPPEELQAAAVVAKAPGLLLTACVSHFLYDELVGNPFFFLGALLRPYSNQTCSETDTDTKCVSKEQNVLSFTAHKRFRQLMRSDQTGSINWRAQFLRLLDPSSQPGHPNQRGIIECKNFIQACREAASKELARSFCCGNAKLLISQQSPEMALADLEKIFIQAGDLAYKIWTQKRTLKVKNMDSIGREFTRFSDTLEEHPFHRMEANVLSALEGKTILLVVHPAVILESSSELDGYDRDDVLQKAIVWMGATS